MRPLSTPALWFRDEAQLATVRAAIEGLADESNMGECRVLMRLFWQLTAPYKDVGMNELLTQVTAEKLRAVGELLVAIAEGHEAVDAWAVHYAPVAPVRQ